MITKRPSVQVSLGMQYPSMNYISIASTINLELVLWGFASDLRPITRGVEGWQNARGPKTMLAVAIRKRLHRGQRAAGQHDRVGA